MIGAEFQKALYDALTGAAVANGRVYDRVPHKPTFPYVTLGDEQVLDEGNTCGDAWEVFSDVHAWSRPKRGSKQEVKALAAEIVVAVLTITAVDGHTLVSIEHQSSRTTRDPDGKTEHTALTFRALIDPT